jgi:REP element-mobilizing transposase RayT
MSKKNTIRRFDSPAFYHVYNRGTHKSKIFLDTRDKQKFLDILARYLDPEVKSVRSDGVAYEKSDAKLVAYCLMGNHYHLLLYQDVDTGDIRRLVSSVQTAYSMYFNLRHRKTGRLFEGPYQASRIDTDSYLAHITRYIHLNPRTYLTYKWSSLPEYTGHRTTPWLFHRLGVDMQPQSYLNYLGDYEARAEFLAKVKKMLDL